MILKYLVPQKISISDADYMVGLHASTLVKDDNEVQIGIVSFGDFLVYTLCLHHQKNNKYQDILEALKVDSKRFPLLATKDHLENFKVSIFSSTEIFVDSFEFFYKKELFIFS